MWRANTGKLTKNCWKLTAINIPKLLLTALISIVVSVSSIKAQDLPSDLTAISQADVPASATYFSTAYYPDYPPLPYNGWDSSGTLYYSPTYGTSYIWVDDRASVAGRMFTSDSVDPPPLPGGDDSGPPCYTCDPTMPLYDYAHNFTNLWLSVSCITNIIEGVTNLQAAVLMHNTLSNLMPYEVFSTTNLSVPMSNWVSEGLWIAYSTNTPANIDVGARTNQNFFRARLWNGQFTYGVPKSGELLLLLPDTNAISAVVNGVTNTITPFYSNWAMARLPATNGNILQTYTFNAGFSGDDLGPTNYFSQFTQQNLHAVVGFSHSISNLALSFNPITNIDVHSWPNLTYLEMWHATNLVAVNVTNCPKLYRVCFEGVDGIALTSGIKDVLDVSGCTNLADLRAANNNITNIILGPNGGSNIWHFCTRDVRGRGGVYPIIQGTPFKSLPSLKQLWVFDDQSFIDNVVLTVTNSPQLESVEAQGNFFQSLTVSGQTNLDHIYLESNLGMTNLVITGCSILKQLRASFDSLPSSVIDAILITLDQNGISTNVADGSLDIELQGGSNGSPSVDGMRAKFNLQAKNWSVSTQPPPTGTPTVSSGPSVSRNSTNATITWATDISSDSTVYYSTDTTFGSSGNVATLTTSHSVTLLGLTPNTTYNYYVHSTSGSLTGTSGNKQFTTLPPPNTNAIWFTNSSTTVAMQVAVVSGASVTWVWGDGTVSNGVTSITKSIGSSSVSNAAVVDPASALLGFGATCDNESSAATTLTSVSGLTNYPNLASLLLVNSHLSNLSLAGCSNLTHVALVHTSPSTNVENGWFTELAMAQQAGTVPETVTPLCSGSGEQQHHFYCPADPGATNRSAGSAYYTLTHSLGWTIVEFGGAQ